MLLLSEEQRELLIQEKEEAVEEIQEKYNGELYEFQNRLNEELKMHKSKETEVPFINNED